MLVHSRGGLCRRRWIARLLLTRLRERTGSNRPQREHSRHRQHCFSEFAFLHWIDLSSSGRALGTLLEVKHCAQTKVAARRRGKWGSRTVIVCGGVLSLLEQTLEVAADARNC